MLCEECYTDQRRATPLLEPRACLEKHTQYICGTCGRCICIEHDEKRGLQRWNFPFKSAEIAKLYLRSADASVRQPCGIYQIVNEKGRASYKIFASAEDLAAYLQKNPTKRCPQGKPIYREAEYHTYPRTQIRRLTQTEAEQYLAEQTAAKERV